MINLDWNIIDLWLNDFTINPNVKGVQIKLNIHIKFLALNNWCYTLVIDLIGQLVTTIPLQLALDCTENAIKNSTVELPPPTDDIMDLLNLCLTSTYFQDNGKQLHGTAMGSTFSVVVAEIVTQKIEEQALATYTRTIPLRLRYVDDTFTAVHKDGIDDFPEHLNKQNADIQFTKEIEENGKILFLDCLVTRDNNKLKTTIYRKPTCMPTDY